MSYVNKNIDKSRIKTFSLIYIVLTFELLAVGLSNHITLNGVSFRQGLTNINTVHHEQPEESLLASALPRGTEGVTLPADRGLGGLMSCLHDYWGLSDLSACWRVWEHSCSHSEQSR